MNIVKAITFILLVIFGEMNKSELLKLWPMTYKGSHISHENVKKLRK